MPPVQPTGHQPDPDPGARPDSASPAPRMLRSGARLELAAPGEALVIHHDPAAARHEAETLLRLDGAAHAPRLLEWLDPLVLRVGPVRGEPLDGLVYRFEAEVAVRILGAAIRAVHELPVPAGSPVTAAADLLAEVSTPGRTTGRRPRHDEAYDHVDDDRLLETLHDGLDRVGSGTDAPVWCHGDPIPAHIRGRGPQPVTVVEWSRSCVADRHLDLAVAARAVAATMTPVLVPVLVEAYLGAGPAVTVDPLRLDWYATLDALR